MTHVTLHIGMPKTGTTTLQHVFEGHHGSGRVFYGPNSAEFPALWVLATLTGFKSNSDSEITTNIFEAFGKTYEKEWPADRCRAMLERLLASHETVVFSIEGLAPLLREDLVLDALYAARQSIDVDVVGYARHPVHLGISTLKQVILNCLSGTPKVADAVGEQDLFWEETYLNYGIFFRGWAKDTRPRHLRIREYKERGEDPTFNLVEEFSHTVGLRPKRSSHRLNTAPSAEVMAILMALIFEARQRSPLALEHIGRVAALVTAHLTGRRLGMGARSQNSLMNRCQADLIWVKEQSGIHLDHLIETGDDVPVDTWGDLNRLAKEALPGFLDHLEATFDHRPTWNDSWIDLFCQLKNHIVAADGGLKVLPSWFDADLYRSAHPEVAASDLSAKAHFRHHGFQEMRSFL